MLIDPLDIVVNAFQNPDHMGVPNQPVKVRLPSAWVVSTQKTACFCLFEQQLKVLQTFATLEACLDGTSSAVGQRLTTGQVETDRVIQLLHLLIRDRLRGGPSVRTGSGLRFKRLFFLRQILPFLIGLSRFSLSLFFFLCLSILLFISLYIFLYIWRYIFVRM